MTFRPNAEMLQDDEILLLTRVFADLGFDKIRLTGGEPTVRANIVDIVRGIASTPGINSLSMTTNGVLLSKLAAPLASAGLDRVNVSLDTLDPAKFKRMTRWGKLEDVWKGILAAEQAGLTPLKLNAVVVRGYNEEDTVELARLTIDHPWQVRFIEMMPFAGATDLQVGPESHRGRDPGAPGTGLRSAGDCQRRRIGWGSAHAARAGRQRADWFHFIRQCTVLQLLQRARLTADGLLRTCLLREHEINLLKPLRAGATQEDLRKLLLDGIWEKPWGHGLAEGVIPMNRVMSEIGG